MDNIGKGKIKNKSNIITRWWQLTQPHKGHFAGQIIFYCIYTILLSLITIFAAWTIDCMYKGDWSGAYINLILEIATIIARNVAIHFQYLAYGAQCRHIRLVVSRKIYNKFLSCKNQELDQISSEKVTNIALNNMGYMSEFPDNIAAFSGKLIQVLFTLVVVYVYNVLAGVIVTVLGIFNFFAYYFFNKKLGKIMLDRYEKKDDMFKSYSKIIESKSVINELKANKTYEDELIGNVDKFTHAYSKYFKVYSYKNNLYFAFWNIIVYAITALMLYYVSNGTLDIAVYLIIIPYLKSCTDDLNSLFDKTSAIENMRVDVDRVNLILNLNDEELIKYGEMNSEANEYNLALINVSEYAKPGQMYSLENVNMSFKTGKVNVIKSEKDNGKRVIFDILRRYNVPDKGKAVLDNLNLYDYNESTFKTHINYCASHPAFIKGSIRENLVAVDKDMANIEKICAELGILNDIQALPKQFDTNISEIDSDVTLFMLGLVRALLTNCKILMIYELPSQASDEFRQNIVALIQKYNIDKTLLIFTHTDDYDKIADRIYEITKGVVQKKK